MKKDLDMKGIDPGALYIEIDRQALYQFSYIGYRIV